MSILALAGNAAQAPLVSTPEPTLANRMVVIQEVVHPRSLNFANQRKVVMLRKTENLSFSDICKRVRNLACKRPSKNMVRRVYKDFSPQAGRRKYQYSKCGRKAWKVTPELRAFVVERLLALRTKTICTSTTLQREVAKKMRIKVVTSTIRKIIDKAGYHWLPRAQKPRLSKERMIVRKLWCQRVLNMSPKELHRVFGLSMDGVILSVPPKDAVDRANFCTVGDTHMYRTRQEAASPDLAGHTSYGKQVPLSRAVPLWAGISYGGFKAIAFHPTKKIQVEEWVAAVSDGKLVDAIKAGNPLLKRGPWRVLCDNEGFMNAKESRAAHRAQKVNLWHVPPRSPDLNPIERFWAWLRRELRKRDLADLMANRPPMGKFAYRKRIVNICRSARARQVAGNCCKALRKVCKEVVLKKGAMARA